MGILYLSRADISGLLPSLPDQLALVEGTLETMMSGRSQLPPKPSIYPRDDSFIHAMPAYLADLDVAAVKWIGGSARNKARGLPYLSGLIVVNDPETAAPRAILDAADITAARTAAVTGVCVARFASSDLRKIAIVGFGVQGQAHARMLAQVNGQAEIVVTGGSAPDDEGGRRLTVVPDVRQALRGAGVVITAVRLERPARPFIRAEWVQDAQLLIPVDFDAALDPSAIGQSDVLMTDHAETFDYYRTLGYFENWPQPTHSLGDALAARLRPSRAVCCNLGVATLDAAFAHAVLENAVAKGVGTLLP